MRRNLPLSGLALTACLAAPLLVTALLHADDAFLGIEITADGKVGVGTETPQAKLHVIGDSITTGTIRGAGYDGTFGDAATLQGYDLGGTGDFSYVLVRNAAMGSVQIQDVEANVLKTFIIPHPVASERYLVHATLEGPEGAVYHRGSARLAEGRAEITLPPYFEASTRPENRSVLLTRVDGFDPITVAVNAAGRKVKDGRFTVYSSNPRSTQAFDWEVKAVRGDGPALVAEPLRRGIEVRGIGPYTYGLRKMERR